MVVKREEARHARGQADEGLRTKKAARTLVARTSRHIEVGLTGQAGRAALGASIFHTVGHGAVLTSPIDQIEFRRAVVAG